MPSSCDGEAGADRRRHVRTAGALAVQVLVAAARDWADDGHTFSLSASAAMQEDLTRLGVLNEFRLQEVT